MAKSEKRFSREEAHRLERKRLVGYITSANLVDLSSEGYLSHTGDIVGQINDDNSVTLRFNPSGLDTMAMQATADLGKRLLREGIPLTYEPPINEIFGSVAEYTANWQRLKDTLAATSMYRAVVRSHLR